MIGAYPGLWYGVHLSRHPRDRNPSVCRATYAMSLRLAPAVNRFILSICLIASATLAHGQFLRQGTHSPPVFMPDEAMSDYYVDQEWRQDPESLPPLRAMEIPFEWAQGWIKNKRTFPRALVMGQPESCPLMAGVYGAPDQETAVRLAFATCFYQMRLLDEHQAEDCGCQLAMLDEILFAEPGGFTNFAAAPGIVRFDDDRNDVPGIVYFGQDLIGRNQDIRFVDADGVQRCEGTYDINAFLFNSARLQCDFFCEPYRGGINIRDFAMTQSGFKPTAEISAPTCEGGLATLRVGKMLGER